MVFIKVCVPCQVEKHCSDAITTDPTPTRTHVDGEEGGREKDKEEVKSDGNNRR